MAAETTTTTTTKWEWGMLMVGKELEILSWMVLEVML